MQQTSSLGGTMLHPRAFQLVAESGSLAALRCLLQAARNPLRVALNGMMSSECSDERDERPGSGEAGMAAAEWRTLVSSLSVLLSRSFHVVHQFAKRCKGVSMRSSNLY